jgi:hypothetical protein
MMTEQSYPPPPPPPPAGSRKMLIAAIAIVVIVAAVAVGVYYLTTTPSSTNPTPTPTSTPSATPTGTPTSSPTGTSTPTPTPSGGGANVAGASSLQYTVSVTNSSGASQGTYTFYAKNAGTSNLMIRIEFTDPSGDNFVYIVNGAQQKTWVYENDEWTDLSDAFSTQWDSWNSAWQGYRNSLAGWTGVGDWTYTDPNGDTIRIYNITVNPSLADSLFQP